MQAWQTSKGLSFRFELIATGNKLFASVNGPSFASGPALASLPLGVAIVAANRTTREALSQLIANDPALRLLGVASGPEDGRRLLENRALRVILVNLRLSERDGQSPACDFIRAAKALRSDVGVLSLKRQAEERLVRAALDAGANACCLATTSQTRLINAVKAVAEGATWLDPEISEILFHRHAPVEPPRHAYALSPRERVILRLVTEGHTNEEIAAELHCGAATIKTHIAHLFRKLEVRDRVSAAVVALRHDLV